MGHYPRLVWDNNGSGSRTSKHRIINRKLAGLAGTIDDEMMTPGDKLLGPPVADGLHGHIAESGNGSRPAEGVDHAIDGVDRFVGDLVHAPHYSALLKKVKRQSAESYQREQSASLSGMDKAHTLTFDQLVGLRVAAARKMAGKTQADVCRTIGVAPNKWNQWERGKYPFDRITIAEFAETYRVDMNWIYLGKTDTMSRDDAETVRVIFKGLLTEKLAA